MSFAASTWHVHTKCYKCWYVCLLEGKLSGNWIHQRSKIYICFWPAGSACDSQGHLQASTGILPVTFASHAAWKSWMVNGDAVNQTDGQEFAKPAAELSEAAAGGATVCVMMFRCFPSPSTFWYRLGQRRCPHFRWAAEWRSQIENFEELINSCVVLCRQTYPAGIALQAGALWLHMRMLQQSYHIWYDYSTFTKF